MTQGNRHTLDSSPSFTGASLYPLVCIPVCVLLLLVSPSSHTSWYWYTYVFCNFGFNCLRLIYISLWYHQVSTFWESSRWLCSTTKFETTYLFDLIFKMIPIEPYPILVSARSFSVYMSRASARVLPFLLHMNLLSHTNARSCSIRIVKTWRHLLLSQTIYATLECCN